MPNKSSLLKILFATFPPQTGDLQSMLEAYEMALDGHDEADVETAVRRFIRGEVEDHNANFAPTAAKLGEAVRAAMNARLDHEHRHRKPVLPPPDVEKSPESRARVAAMVAGVVERTAEQLRTDDAAKAKSAQWAKTNARFMPDQGEDAMHERLGYSVGDPEDDRDAA